MKLCTIVVGPPVHESSNEGAANLEQNEEESSKAVETALLGAQHEGEGHGRVDMGSRDTAGDQATEPEANTHGSRGRMGGQVSVGQQEGANQFQKDSEEVS